MTTEPKLRLLVAIASYGERNSAFLKRIIANYGRMRMEVDIVVLSEAFKDLGPSVEVIVGLPSPNPWSLPFAHKRLFSDRSDRYDLFVYSEDDMEVTEANIQAFLRITPHLEHNEIAGFLRYEEERSGDWSLPDVHASYHWKPDSVRRRGAHTCAEFTNEHAAFYILTQAQLRKAIASGGFLQAPYEGRHDMLCAAATDPYTSCGFRKVICISSLEEFLIHHLSNRYAGQVGLVLGSFKEQIDTLMEIRDGTHPAFTLCGTESRIQRLKWSKSYYEPPDQAILEMVPLDAKRILSIGCGWGATEVELKRRGFEVTALPLDSVIGAVAARRGVEVVHSAWDQCLEALGGRRFDCVLMTNLLHLQREPGKVLARCSRLIGPGGTLVVSGPNFTRVPYLTKRILAVDGYRNLRRFEEGGITVCGPSTLANYLEKADSRVTSVRWFNHAYPGKRLAKLRTGLGRLTAMDWVVQARID